jgi:hypothetical protein
LKKEDKKKVVELSRDWLRNDTGGRLTLQKSVPAERTSFWHRNMAKIGLLMAVICVVAVVVGNLTPREQAKPQVPNMAHPLSQAKAPVAPLLGFNMPLSPAPSSNAEEAKAATDTNVKESLAANLYPSGWPDELVYPNEFGLVDANTVRIPDKYLPAYAVQMRFAGDIQSAADTLSSYYKDRGWQLTYRMELDSGALLMKISRNDGRDNGEITIDPYPDEDGNMRIVAIVFM